MDITGKMERAVAGDGIKTGRICLAEKLYLPCHLFQGLLRATIHQPWQGKPGGPTGGAPEDINGAYPAVLQGYLILRYAELLAISAKRIFFCQAATGDGADSSRYLARPTGYHGNTLPATILSAMVHQVRMLKKAKDKGALDMVWEKLLGIVDEIRKGGWKIYNLNDLDLLTVDLNTLYFLFSGAPLLKDSY